MNEKTKERWEAKNILGYPRFHDLPYVENGDGLSVCRMSGGNCEDVEARAVLIAAAPETAAERDALKAENALIFMREAMLVNALKESLDEAKQLKAENAALTAHFGRGANPDPLIDTVRQSKQESETRL